MPSPENSIPSSCPTLHASLQELKTLVSDFVAALSAASESGDLAPVLHLKAEIELKRVELRDLLRIARRERYGELIDLATVSWWDSEKQEMKTSSLEEQYEAQLDMLNYFNFIDPYSLDDEVFVYDDHLDDDKEPDFYGMKGIDGKAHPIPSFEQIMEAMTKDEETREKYETKMKQGFTRLLVVPFAAPLSTLTHALKGMLPAYAHRGYSRTVRDLKDPNEVRVPLEINKNDPLFIWDKYSEADVNGSMVYYPTQLTRKNHGGKTKQELLIGGGAWHILLVEENPNAPRTGQSQAQTLNGRTQLETSKTSIKYLDIIGKTETPYHNEQVLTVEDEIMRVLTYLESTHTLIGDYQGNGTNSFLLGSLFPESAFVADAGFNRLDGQFRLDIHGAGSSGGFSGTPSSVGVIL